MSRRKLTVGDLSVWTGGSATTFGARTQEVANQKALVVNFRRLVRVKGALEIIHGTVKATAFALLTLLAANNTQTLVYDLAILGYGTAVFSLHELSHQQVNTADFKRLVGLLGNDGEDVLMDAPYPGGLRNPNRYLQALTFSNSGGRAVTSLLLLAVFLSVGAGAWFVVVRLWVFDGEWHRAPLPLDLQPKQSDFGHYVTLLVVGTLMLVCHLIFELVCLREFKYRMPLKRGKPWDLDVDGIPLGNLNWLFGLPCMWFSTEAAYDDLRIWLTLARGAPRADHRPKSRRRRERVVFSIFAEELAMYAVDGPKCAARLRECLLTAKLYDKKERRFMRRSIVGEVDTTGRPALKMTGLARKSSVDAEFLQVDCRRGGALEKPSELGLELLFYDARSGDVWVPPMPKDLDGNVPEALHRERSFLDEMLS